MLSKQYIAGFVDGDGCIGTTYAPPNQKFRQKSPTIQLRVSIGSTYLPLLEIFQEQYGGAIHKRKELVSKNWKPFYMWIITTRKAVTFLKEITPFLIIKKPIGEYLLKNEKYFRRNCKGGHGVRVPPKILRKRLEMHKWCCHFNKPGKN